MKHVGLNVAADPFMSAALVSIHGGLVLAVADDPGMHSSQNEQDSRYFANFAGIICLEPSSHQETYDMTREAFRLSEKHHLPVMLRIVTRLAHARGAVEFRAPEAERPIAKAKASGDWILLPSNARRRWHERLKDLPHIQKELEKSSFNPLFINAANENLGVITTGMARSYYLENTPDLKEQPSHLHIGAYPFPAESIRELAQRVKKILIMEEGYPFVERFLRGILPTQVTIAGKLSGDLPPDGELNPDIVRKALHLPSRSGLQLSGPALPGRPPQLCAGCPHIDSYGALRDAASDFGLKLITSDIGCYTLGAMPEYQAIESCVCMGASVGMAKGASDAGLRPAIAVLGDSTFLHSGMQPLLDAIAHNTPMTLLILDNKTTGMTGGQPTIAASSHLRDLVIGLGVNPEHVHVMTTHRTEHAKNTALLKQEIGYMGLSVMILVRECIETAKRKPKTPAKSGEVQS